MPPSRLHIKSELEQLTLLYDFCQANSIDNKSLLALEEAVVNIVNYSAASYIDITYLSNENSDTFIIVDDGIRFDPTSFALSESNAEGLRTGGQGLRIIRKMMDSINYRRDDNKNTLTLIRFKQ